MSTKVAINGFGRIGRLALRAMLERHKQELTVVAVNDMADLQTNAHLFRYDSTYGIFPGRIETGEGVLKIDDWEIMVLNQKDPSRLPWRALGVDIVIESTGVFTDGDHVRSHLEAGAKKVIITAPATNEDITLVLGVNDSAYNPDIHHIVSNASCTTNCLAPVTKVLQEIFGIERGLMVPALISGDVQGGIAGANAVISAVLGGASIVSVASLANRPYLRLWVQPEINRLEDLRGKTLGVSRFGATTDNLTRILLRKVGLEGGVNLRQLGGTVEVGLAFRHRQIDGAVLATLRTDAQYRILANLAELGIQYSMRKPSFWRPIRPTPKTTALTSIFGADTIHTVALCQLEGSLDLSPSWIKGMGTRRPNSLAFGS